jgi:uncharacterized membrane protein
MTKDETKIDVSILNSGNEPANNVQITPLLSSVFSTEPVSFEKLTPNEPKEAEFKVKLNKEAMPGNYPVAILTDYADVNGYPFSSVSPSFIVYKTRTTSKVSGVISDVSLTDKNNKKLVLTLRNLDDTSHNIKIKMFIPRELKISEDEKEITIGSKDEKELNFEISSLSALAGSSYLVLASIDYEDSVLHYSTFARGIVKIELGKSFEFPLWLPIVSFIVLLIIFFYYFKRGKK